MIVLTGLETRMKNNINMTVTNYKRKVKVVMLLKSLLKYKCMQ